MEIIPANISATVIESQIPFVPAAIGRRMTESIWKTSVRVKDNVLETSPLLRATNIAAVKILNQQSRNDHE